MKHHIYLKLLTFIHYIISIFVVESRYHYVNVVAGESQTITLVVSSGYAYLYAVALERDGVTSEYASVFYQVGERS